MSCLTHHTHHLHHNCAPCRKVGETQTVHLCQQRMEYFCIRGVIPALNAQPWSLWSLAAAEFSMVASRS
jgi:hypothetical protein